MQTNSLTSPATPEPEKKKPKAKPEKGNLRLFRVSQAFQLFDDFHQSLKPPCVVGYSRAIFRVDRIFAVLFGEFSYFLSQLLDTLCDESWHYNLPASCRESSLSGIAVLAECRAYSPNQIAAEDATKIMKNKMSNSGQTATSKVPISLRESSPCGTAEPRYVRQRKSNRAPGSSLEWCGGGGPASCNGQGNLINTVFAVGSSC